MQDRSHAPDHVFRDELASFEDAPAWHEELDTITLPDGRVVTGPTEDDWQVVADAFDVPVELLGEPPVRFTNARVHIVDGVELPEPVEVRSMDIHVRGVDRLAAILEQAVGAGRRDQQRRRMAAAGERMLRDPDDERSLLHVVSPWMRSAIDAAVEFDQQMQRTMDRLDVTGDDIDAMADQLRNTAATPGGWVACSYCGDPIGQRDRDGAWTDENGLQSCAPRAAQHEPEMIAGMIVVRDERVPEGGPWLVGPIVDEVRVLEVGDGGWNANTMAVREVGPAFEGLPGSSWLHAWDGEQIPDGCIADTEDSLEGGAYIPCGAPTGEDEDWCPTHKAAIRARAEGDL